MNLASAGLDSLREQLVTRYDRISRSSLSWTLSGPTTFSGAISVDFLADAISAFQATVSSIGQAVEGAPTARARIPAQVRAMTEMRLVGTFQGSFGLNLEGPVAVPQSFPGFAAEFSQQPLFERSLETLFDLLEQGGTATDSPNDNALDRLAAVGPRSVGHLKQLANAISKADATARFDWAPPADFGEARAITFGTGAANRLGQLLKLTSVSERSETHLGQLMGASMIRDTFEFQLLDGDVLRGRVEASLIDALPDFFGRECRGTFLITSATARSTGAVVERWSLTGIDAPSAKP